MRSIPTSGERIASMPSATTFSASMSRPESVSSRIAKRGWNMCICKISRRFFSPPENPSLTERVMNESSTPRSFMFSASSVRNCGIGMSFCLISPVPSTLTTRSLISRLDMHPLPRRGLRELREGHAIEGLRDAVLQLEPHGARAAVGFAHAVQDRLSLGGTDLWFDWAFECAHDITGGDVTRLAGQDVTAARSALPVHEAGLAKDGDELLEVGLRQVLTLRNGVQR